MDIRHFSSIQEAIDTAVAEDNSVITPYPVPKETVDWSQIDLKGCQPLDVIDGNHLLINP